MCDMYDYDRASRVCCLVSPFGDHTTISTVGSDVWVIE